MWSFFPALSSMISEFVAGAVTASLIGIGTWSYKRFERRKIEKRFPLSGSYISFYDDLAEGKKVVMASTSRIAQRGRNITITTTDLEGRSWTLDGTISQGNHISGVYSADEEYDEGVGSFYFRIEKNQLNGMWSGFDHANRIINGGRYWMKRRFPAEIRAFEPGDINDIMHASAGNFGFGYIGPDQIRHDERSFTLVATVEETFAGFCLGGLQDEGQVRTMLHDHPAPLPDDVHFADLQGHLGVIKSIVVEERFRGHGVGFALLEAAEQALVERGAQCIVVPAWSVGNRTAVASLLKLRGYAEWLHIPEYWREGCEAGQFRCIAFRDRCRCSVVFYRKGRL